jgi:hypothetical protein
MDGASPAGTHIYHVECIGPDGKIIPHYSGTVLAPGGVAARVIPLAASDPAGKWTLRVTEVLTGQTRSAVFHVQ